MTTSGRLLASWVNAFCKLYPALHSAQDASISTSRLLSCESRSLPEAVAAMGVAKKVGQRNVVPP